MVDKSKLFLFIICTFIFISCNYEAKNPSISAVLKDDGWLMINTIAYKDDSWNLANRTSPWKVGYNNKLEISKSVDTSSVVKLRIGNGYLEGLDHGEWGGRLTFYPESDLSERTNIIEGGNIVSIFIFDKNIYALEGTFNLGYSVGKLIRLNQNSGHWEYKIILDLKDKPYAYSIINDEYLYLVTNRTFIKINRALESEIIIENAFWESLYPNSIIIINEEAIIGMRGLVATVNLKNKKVTAFMKQ
jgi:hypothetical protein